MKGIVLVGGEGTRLRPLTCNVPKPMVPIANRPFLERMIEQLKFHGIDDIVLCMGYLPDRIRNYFGDGDPFGVRITYVVEQTPLGTAGAVKNVENYLDGTCFVFNADVMTDLDLSEMLRFHRERSAAVTIALTPVDDPTAYGIVERDEDERVRRFLEKPGWDEITTNMVNAGTYIIEPRVLKGVPADSFYMFERGLFPALLEARESVYGFPSDAYWIDIGTPQRYLAVHYDLLHGKVSGNFPGAKIANGIWVGEGTKIDSTARISGPVVIGNGCIIGRHARITGPSVLGDNCEIGPDTTIEAAVLWQSVRVKRQVVLRNVMVGEGVCIEDGVWLAGEVVVGDGALIGQGNKLEYGARIWPGKVLEAGTITF